MEMHEASKSALPFEVAVTAAKGGQRQHLLKELAATQQELAVEDFYELLGIPKYSELTPEVSRLILAALEHLLQRWNSEIACPELQEECEKFAGLIRFAQEVLSNPDLKRRYDIELQRLAAEDSCHTLASLTSLNMVLVILGIAMVAWSPVGFVLSPVAGGSLSMVGGGAIGAGLRCSAVVGGDPDMGVLEYFKELLVGASQGLLCAAIGLCPLGAAVAAATGVVHVGLQALANCAMYGSCHVVSDVTDLFISQGYLGSTLRMSAPGCKTAEEVLCRRNFLRFAAGCALGPAIGPLIQARPRTVEVRTDLPPLGQRQAKNLVAKLLRTRSKAKGSPEGSFPLLVASTAASTESTACPSEEELLSENEEDFASWACATVLSAWPLYWGEASVAPGTVVVHPQQSRLHREANLRTAKVLDELSSSVGSFGLLSMLSATFMLAAFDPA